MQVSLIIAFHVIKVEFHEGSGSGTNMCRGCGTFTKRYYRLELNGGLYIFMCRDCYFSNDKCVYGKGTADESDSE
jgi:hypothetical protein